MLSKEQAGELITFLNEYNNHFLDVLDFYNEKSEKATEDDLEWLMLNISTEEKLIMRGDALERTRLALMESYGVGDYKADELIAACPAPQAGSVKRAIDSIYSAVYYIKETSRNILELIETKLEIARKLDEKGFAKSVANTGTYDKTGQKAARVFGGVEEIGKI